MIATIILNQTIRELKSDPGPQVRKNQMTWQQNALLGKAEYHSQKLKTSEVVFSCLFTGACVLLASGICVCLINIDWFQP